MRRGRPMADLTLSVGEREQLVCLTRSRSMPHALVTRAQIVLLATNLPMYESCGRLYAHGLAGGSGAAKGLSDVQRAGLLSTV